MDDEAVGAEPRTRRRAPDPRPARTRSAIIAAVERLPDLPAEQVTVSAIARDAGVSRSVFYTHFSGLEDLLSAVLAETAEKINPSAGETGGLSALQLSTTSLKRLVDHVQSRATFYKAAFAWNTTAGLHQAAIEGYARHIRDLTESIRSSTSSHRALPPIDYTDFAATFVAGGFIAALTDWLRTGQTIPSEALVQKLLGLLPEWLVSDGETSTETEHNSCRV